VFPTPSLELWFTGRVTRNPPGRTKAFTWILTAALVISLVIALIGLDPVQLDVLGHVLNGALAPVMVVFLPLVGNNVKIMKGSSGFGWPTNPPVVAAVKCLRATAILFTVFSPGREANNPGYHNDPGLEANYNLGLWRKIKMGILKCRYAASSARTTSGFPATASSSDGTPLTFAHGYDHMYGTLTTWFRYDICSSPGTIEI